jgi:hypothetical protein
MVPLALLAAFLWAQGAVGFGLATFFLALHIPVREWQQSPLVQEYLQQYPAWRRNLMHIYPRAAALLALIATIVCLVFSGINVYASTRPNARLALPGDIAGMMLFATEILAFQAFLIVLGFVQRWRGQRTLRKMARRRMQTQQAPEEGAGQPTLSSNQ